MGNTVRQLPNGETITAERLKEAMEAAWDTGPLYRANKPMRWIFPGDTGGWVLPGLDNEPAAITAGCR